jgi:hypothetical protein
MLDLKPVGFERFPPLVNPVKIRISGRGRDTPPLDEAKPVLLANPTEHDDRRERDHTFEKLYKLTVDTRRELLLLSDDHPLNGSHPTN